MHFCQIMLTYFHFPWVFQVFSTKVQISLRFLQFFKFPEIFTVFQIPWDFYSFSNSLRFLQFFKFPEIFTVFQIPWDFYSFSNSLRFLQFFKFPEIFTVFQIPWAFQVCGYPVFIFYLIKFYEKLLNLWEIGSRTKSYKQKTQCL